jgi:hypothetical protein
MANNILWQLATSVDPFGSYVKGLEQNERQQNILQQLAGQKEDRQLRRDEFGYRQGRDTVGDRHWQQTFDAGRTDAANVNARGNASLALQRAQFERGAFPVGYQADPNTPGGMRVVPGGPQDPATLRAAAQAQRGPVIPAIKEIDLPNGTKISVQQNPDGSISPINVPGVTNAQPTNPYANGKLTNDQSNAGLFADRMNDANKVITKNEHINEGVGGYLAGSLVGKSVPVIGAPLLPNIAQSPERQQVEQAKRNFVNAVLRKESGAAISQSEFDNAYKQYFPVPGDSQAVIDQKRQNRDAEMRGLMRAAGPNYTPPDGALPQQSGGLPSGWSVQVH